MRTMADKRRRKGAAVTAGTLQEWCAELGRWLPTAQALIGEPDTDGTRTHTAPTSRPPWNGAVAAAVLDAHEGVRRLEASLRKAVTGRPGPRRGGSDANTQAAIVAIGQLAYAVDEDGQRVATVYVARLVTPMRQLPAVDEDERPRKVAWPCRYCGFEMLRIFPRSGRVTCLRQGACFDLDGNHPIGHMGLNLVTQEGAVYWQDGSVTP